MINVIGIGQNRENMTLGAIRAIEESDVIVGYKKYVAQISDLVSDKEIIKNVYNVEKIEDINKVILEKIKEINAQIPKYKAIRGMILTEEPLIKTTTNKIKRQANLDRINAELQR